MGAILNAFIPSGTHGSRIIVDTIFGRNGNRFGKLPYTLYPEAYAASVPLDGMSMTEGVGRSYRYYRGEVVYPFGHGLHYGQATISRAHTTAPVPASSSNNNNNKNRGGDGGGSDNSALVPPAPAAFVFKSLADTHNLSVAVTNTGKEYHVGEVVLLFAVPDRTSVRANGAPLPIKTLIDFQRVEVPIGQSVTATFCVKAEALALVDLSGNHALFPGQFTLMATTGTAGSEYSAVNTTADVQVETQIVIDTV